MKVVEQGHSQRPFLSAPVPSIRPEHPLDPPGLGLDELDVQERVGRDPLEADVPLGVDQERAVERLALEVVVGAGRA